MSNSHELFLCSTGDRRLPCLPHNIRFICRPVPPLSHTLENTLKNTARHKPGMCHAENLVLRVWLPHSVTAETHTTA